MTEPTQISTPPPDQAPNPPIEAPAPRPLTAALVAAGDAVHDELQEANQLAADLDAQLAGKSKEVLHLKFVLDRTKAHFGHLQDSVAALRKERHQLANDVMKAQGLAFMLSDVTTDRDRLKFELNAALQSLAAQNAQSTATVAQRDQTIAELTFELVKLRRESGDLRRTNPDSAPSAAKASNAATSVNPFAESNSWKMAKLEIVPTARIPGGRGNR